MASVCGSLTTTPRHVHGLPRRSILSTDDVAQVQGRDRRVGLWREGALDAVLEIGGGHRVAILELNAIAKGERVRSTVVREGPATRDVGDNLERRVRDGRDR